MFNKKKQSNLNFYCKLLKTPQKFNKKYFFNSNIRMYNNYLKFYNSVDD